MAINTQKQMLNELLSSIDRSLDKFQIPNAINSCNNTVNTMWDVLNKLCSSIKYTKNDNVLNLGFDTDELITDYIKRHYGNDTKRREKYMLIAEEFKEAIEDKFSTKCTVDDLNWNVTTGLFDFNFSRADNSQISVRSCKYAGDRILVYIHVQKLETRDKSDY